jgi:Transglycosylase SLT domain
MSINKTFNSTPGAFKNEPGNGRISDSKVYIAFVKNNVDQQRMGRLEVYIPDIGGEPTNSAHWFIASYASPFAGVSDPANMQTGSHSYDGSQQSYGWWAVPPDLENQVLVMFINGDPNKCFWFACLYNQNMNHMVPGVAIDSSFEQQADGSLPPVVEYNRKDRAVNVNSPVRPRFDPLALGIQTQGLTQDFERGSASSSARREAPSRVFGYLTPRANQVYVDDNPDNEFIRLRTRSGTQVLVHETNGYVYINSGLGNSWIEVSDAGVDIYSKGSISMHTEQDFNVRADRNILMDAGNNIVMTAGNNINLMSGNDTTALAGANLRFNATSGEITALAGANVNITGQGTMTLKSGGVHNRSAPQILDNVSTPADATTVSPPTTVPQNNGSTSVNSPVSRMPNHEPWNGHPKSKAATPPSGVSGGTFTPDGTTNRASTIKTVPGEGTTNVPPSSAVETGDGATKTVQAGNYTGTTVNVNNMKIRADVLAAIQKAATITGMDYGQLMAMCWIESKFDPNAKAGTSSAYGLYQFIDDTWAAMVKKYGTKYNFTASMRSDVEAQAMCGAAYMAENKKYLQNNLAAGTAITATDLYLAHFLGPAGASKFLKVTPTADATTAVTPSQARANASIFKPGSTVQDVYNHFAGIMEPRSTAYAATWTGGTATA